MSGTFKYPTAKDAVIAPSILSANFATLGQDCRTCINTYKADWLHIDIMDGHFVPNITFGAPVVKSLRQYLSDSVFFDCHMMVSKPEQWVDEFAKSGCNSYTFHIEATNNPNALIDTIHNNNMKACAAIKPNTPASTVYDIAHKLDMILVMTVEPGFGGQKFMSDQCSKVNDLRLRYPDINIEVDGGISDGDSINAVAKAGANVAVSGSGIFGSKDPVTAVLNMRQTIQQSIHSGYTKL